MFKILRKIFVLKKFGFSPDFTCNNYYFLEQADSLWYRTNNTHSNHPLWVLVTLYNFHSRKRIGRPLSAFPPLFDDHSLGR